MKHVDELQRDQYTEKVHVIFTMGNMDNEKGVTHFHEPYQPPNMDAMIPYKHTYMGDFIQGLVDPTSIPKDHISGVGGKAYFNQLLKFTDGRDIDFKSIPYWCDMFVTPPVLLGWDFLGVSMEHSQDHEICIVKLYCRVLFGVLPCNLKSNSRENLLAKKC